MSTVGRHQHRVLLLDPSQFAHQLPVLLLDLGVLRCDLQQKRLYRVVFIADIKPRGLLLLG